MHVKKIARALMVWLILVLAVLAITVFTGGLLLEKQAGPLVKKKIEAAGAGKFHFYYSGITLNLFSRRIEMHDVTLVPASTDSISRGLFCVAASRLSLSGIQFSTLLGGDALFAKRLDADKVLIVFKQHRGNDSTAKKAFLPPELRLDAVNVQDGILAVIAGEDQVFYSEKDMLMIKGLDLGPGKTTGYDSISIALGPFRYSLLPGMYSIHGKGVSASSSDSLLVVNAPELIPLLSKKDFGHAAWKQVCRVKVSAAKIGLYQLDAWRFITANELFAKGMLAENMNMAVFRDQRKPIPKIDRESLQAILFDLPLKVSVDTVNLISGKLNFELRSNQGPIGKLSISSMKGLITGFQNVRRNSDAELQFMASGEMYGKGKMYLYCNFPMDSRQEHFHVRGSMDSFSMLALNDFLEPVSGLRVRSGIIDSMSFHFRADPKQSNGELFFFYHDLHIESGNNDNKKALAALGNLLVRDSNPGKVGGPRTGKIQFKRDPYRYFPYYISRSVISGVPGALGVPLTISGNGSKNRR